MIRLVVAMVCGAVFWLIVVMAFVVVFHVAAPMMGVAAGVLAGMIGCWTPLAFPAVRDWVRW